MRRRRFDEEEAALSLRMLAVVAAVRPSVSPEADVPEFVGDRAQLRIAGAGAVLRKLASFALLLKLKTEKRGQYIGRVTYELGLLGSSARVRHLCVEKRCNKSPEEHKKRNRLKT